MVLKEPENAKRTGGTITVFAVCGLVTLSYNTVEVKVRLNYTNYTKYTNSLLLLLLTTSVFKCPDKLTGLYIKVEMKNRPFVIRGLQNWQSYDAF